MPTLATKNFATLVQDFAASAQGASKKLIDFTVGSILRAVAETTSAALLWLQGIVLQVLKATRLATSVGADADTWVADFGLTRIGAVAATGLATFSRASITVIAQIPVGALVSTADNSLDFTVYADTTNTAYNAATQSYTILAGVAGLDVPVQAATAGSVGNVVAGAISVLKTGISGVDNVSNAANFITGMDEESDAALRTRFVNFINQLAKGTNAALTYAAQTVQQGVQVQIFNGQDPVGNTDYGHVTMYVDDGSGAIPGGVLATVSDRANAARAAGDRLSVLAATTLLANVTATLSYTAGYYSPTVISQVVAAVTAFVNGLGLGTTLDYRKLNEVIYDATAGVAKINTLTVNGGGVDLVAGRGQTIKIGSLVVS